MVGLENKQLGNPSSQNNIKIAEVLLSFLALSLNNASHN